MAMQEEDGELVGWLVGGSIGWRAVGLVGKEMGKWVFSKARPLWVNLFSLLVLHAIHSQKKFGFSPFHYFRF